MRYILASASPRRRELLKKIIPDFEAVVSNVDETFDPNLSPAQNAVNTALKKARAAYNLVKNTSGGGVAVIAADTVVVLGNEVFGKPANRGEAFAMLKKLSGVWQEVITGTAVITDNVCRPLTANRRSSAEKTKEICFFRASRVYIGAISDEMIYNYIDTGAAYDKAGGYGIQDGERFFDFKYEGNFDNIVGLPTEELREILIRLKLIINN